MAGFEGHARLVGYALHALKSGSSVPWHRVINAKGKISLSGLSGRTQQKLLKREKIHVSPAGRIDLSVYRWRGDSDDVGARR
jgi:methylated-DNA-protein-cysteine methyltransferase-like protein